MKQSTVPMVVYKPHYMADKSCGYCNGEKDDHYALTSMKGTKSPSRLVAIGTSVEQMSCSQYDELINQGFRRSGTFLYRPDLLRTCCRLYTIRTNHLQLKINKQHRKVVNRFIREIFPDEDITKHSTNKQFQLTSLLQAQQKSLRFHTRYEPSRFSKDKFELYKKYQVSVHNDKPHEVSESLFKRFLCDTPFTDKEVDGFPHEWTKLNDWVANWDGNPTNNITHVGPVHECYYLDNKLIAVSMMDFLPTGVSSIYFIWDPDYAHLSLGTLSGLREILMCQQLNLGYYYLGFYIDDCEKMKYKAKFGGELLDLCNEVYVPLETARPYIQNGRLFVLGDEEDTGEAEMEQTGHPIAFEESRFAESTYDNVADKIYANKQVTGIAEASYKVLQEKYGVSDGEGVAELYKMPLVVPGLISMAQILDWFENGHLDDEFPVSIFHLMTSHMDETVFGDLTSDDKLTVVSCIRLFGLSKTLASIILV